MSSAPPKQNEFLTRKYIDGVYIPSGLLVFGCLIVKREWVPYAVVLALLLGGYKVYSNSMYPTYSAELISFCAAEVQANIWDRSSKGSQPKRVPEL
jgi:hypothetical protein